MLFRRAAKLISLTIWLTSLTACANSSVGKNIERSLAADPRLKENVIARTNNQLKTNTIQIPASFPTEIPLYPNARLQQVTAAFQEGSKLSTTSTSNGMLTRWASFDPSNAIESFYQKQFQTNNWQLIRPSVAGSVIEARRNNLQVIVSIQPQPTTSTNSVTPSPGQLINGLNSTTATEFTIQYALNPSETALATSTPQPGGVNSTESKTSDKSGDGGFTDLNQTPQEYSQYIKALSELGVLPLDTNSSQPTQFQPNKIITRREYARWLFSANNKIHDTTPAQQIHLGVQTDRAAFQDVPPTDPDFAVIQGLAEAGLIPSPLAGENTAVLFRPDAPLTREQMILQKVPLDTRHVLPNASVDAVKQTWGFQDAAQINPLALRAVLADFQNGDQSNIRRVFGYTTLFQPQKPVTRAEAAAALWYFGNQGEGLSAQDVLRIKTQQSQPSAIAPTSSSSR